MRPQSWPLAANANEDNADTLKTERIAPWRNKRTIQFTRSY